MLEKYTKWILSHPWQAILLSLVILGALVPGLSRLSMDQDYRVFFAKEFPPLTALENLHGTYNKNDNLLIVIDPPDKQVFSAESLEIVRELTERAWKLPYSVRVESITNYQHTYANGDELVVDDFVRDPSALSDDELRRLREIAVTQPELVNRLISENGAVTGINVTVELPGNANEQAGLVMGDARKLAQEFEERYSGLGIHLTGVIPMNFAFPEASFADMGTLVPAMYGVIILLMAILLRSFWGTIGTLMVITFSVVGALGITGFFGIHFTPPSASTPTMIMTLALAAAIHFLTYFFHSMRKGMSRDEAIADSLHANVRPMILTSIAAAIGFLSMNASESPPFRDLGNITAFGVGTSLLFTLLFLPALMRLVPIKGKVGDERIDRLSDRVAEFVVAKRRSLLFVTVPAVFLLGAGIPQTQLNDEWLTYFGEDFTFRIDTEFAADKLTGIYTIEYSIPAKDDWGIAEPEYLTHLEKFVEWYRAHPKVRNVAAVTDMMKRINMNMHGDAQEWYRLPDSRLSGSELLMIYEMSLPYGHDLNNMIDVSKSATRVVVSLDTVSAIEMKEIEKEAETWLRDNAPDYMFAHGSSPTVMFTHISQRNIRQMLSGTTIALIMVSIVLVFALRSVKLGAISLLPNLVPAVLGFGLWGFLVGEVGLATSIVAGMTLGIVVDDSVHFLSKYRRARMVFNAPPEEAVRYAFRTVGSAMFVTTVVLVAGFLVLSQSTFEMNAGMGMLTSIVILFALVADFTLLPALLLTFDRAKDSAADVTVQDIQRLELEQEVAQ